MFLMRKIFLHLLLVVLLIQVVRNVQFDLSRNVKTSVSSTPARGDAPRSAAQLPHSDVSQIAELAPGNLQGANMTQFGNVTESSSLSEQWKKLLKNLKRLRR